MLVRKEEKRHKMILKTRQWQSSEFECSWQTWQTVPSGSSSTKEQSPP